MRLIQAEKEKIVKQKAQKPIQQKKETKKTLSQQKSKNWDDSIEDQVGAAEKSVDGDADAAIK